MGSVPAAPSVGPERSVSHSRRRVKNDLQAFFGRFPKVRMSDGDVEKAVEIIQKAGLAKSS
jgi:hypothetical protein